MPLPSIKAVIKNHIDSFINTPKRKEEKELTSEQKQRVKNIENNIFLEENVARENIELSESSQIRQLKQVHVKGIMDSIRSNVLSLDRLRLLLYERDNGKFELIGGNHRFKACCRLFDEEDKDAVEMLVKENKLFFPAEVIPKHIAISDFDVKLMALRSNKLNETAVPMHWTDIITKMITDFEPREVADKHFKNIWEKQTTIILKKSEFSKMRTRGLWILNNNAVDLWRSLLNVFDTLPQKKQLDELIKLDCSMDITHICLYGIFGSKVSSSDIVRFFTPLHGTVAFIPLLKDFLKEDEIRLLSENSNSESVSTEEDFNVLGYDKSKLGTLLDASESLDEANNAEKDESEAKDVLSTGSKGSNNATVKDSGADGTKSVRKRSRGKSLAFQKRRKNSDDGGKESQNDSDECSNGNPRKRGVEDDDSAEALLHFASPTSITCKRSVADPSRETQNVSV